MTQPSQPVSLSSREEGSDSESSSSFSVSNAAECKIENEVKPSVTDAVNNIRGVVSLGNNGLLHSNSNGRRSTGMVDRNRGMSPCQDSRTQILRRLSEALMRQSLTKIDMSQRGLQSSDAKLLKLALMQNAHLTVLKLGYNSRVPPFARPCSCNGTPSWATASRRERAGSGVLFLLAGGHPCVRTEPTVRAQIAHTCKFD